MPPMRFNYQQRVGRAGRRSKAFSTGLTLCRGRSHDFYYYKKPGKITSDAPPIPFLTMSQPRIPRRIITKECLRLAFLQAGVTWSDSRKGHSSTHGEFGQCKNWVNVKQFVTNWLRTSPKVKDIVEAITYPNYVEETQHIKFISSELPNQIEEWATKVSLSERNLAGILAENGILPMYGMPTRTRMLYHKLDNKEYTIDRDIEIAITEFAPGSQKTKDKVIHTAIGFTADLVKQEWNNNWKPVSSDPFEYKGLMIFAQHAEKQLLTLKSPPSQHAKTVALRLKS